ncbi:MAG: type VI secretion system ATPase TssH, partial [Spirosomaceae bacterium]|nr:type VI secretion system ATPase TssH [Spirosomataceae bacterium]
IDEIVLFDPLSRENIRQIVEIQFAETKRRLAEQGITIDATVEVLDKLGEEGFDPVFGARPLKRVMQRRILNELSKLVLGNQISKDAVILMELDDNQEIKFVNVEEAEVV